MKKVVAVLFGGMSPEHDVSVLTGIQTLEAIDSSKYTILPVYIDRNGAWWQGPELVDRKNYHFSEKTKKKLLPITFNVGDNQEKPHFDVKPKGRFSKSKKLYFDIAFLAFHGDLGENGPMQGVFELARVPYVGARVFASAVFMNKSISKTIFKEAGVPVLDETIVKRPCDNEIIDIKKIMKDVKVKYPVCAKPCNLGSSIGVHKATNKEELQTAILNIFKIDNEVLIEPFVDNLVEYNVSVTKSLTGEITLSAIERPIKEDLVLSFADKYLSGGDMDSKLSVPLSEGMASATRELNVKIPAKQKKIIEESAKTAFACVAGTGAPRIDFLCNSKTGEIWLNEVNPIPGSWGYYLWEARKPKVPFTKLLTALIEEGFSEHNKQLDKKDLQSFGAAIFPQRKD